MTRARAFFSLLFLLAPALYAADDFKVVLLDSKDGHVLRGKLICLMFPIGDPKGGVIEHGRECRRTDSTGAAGFSLPEGDLARIQIALASDGLVPCFTAHDLDLAEALKTGAVAPNTCDKAETDTTEPGELVVFAHQTSLWEAMKARRNEF